MEIHPKISQRLVAAALVTLPLTQASANIGYDFDDGTLQGWSNVFISSTSGGPTQFTAQNPPNEGLIDGDPNPRSGEFMVAPDPFDTPGLGGPRDFPHETLILRSPEFQLTGAGAGDLSLFLIGGVGGSATPIVTPNSASTGFLGVALRRVSDESYVLSGNRTSNSQLDTGWQEILWTESELLPLGTTERFTIDLIDSHDGSWGWIGLDDVSIPGVRAVPSTETSGALLALSLLGLAAARPGSRRPRTLSID